MWLVRTDAGMYWTGTPTDRKFGVRYPWSKYPSDAFVFEHRADAETFSDEHVTFMRRPTHSVDVIHRDMVMRTENEELWSSWYE